MRQPLLMIVLLMSLVTTVDAVQDGRYELAVSAYKDGNYLKAKSLFLELAKEGNVEAQVNLGEIYDKGRGVAQSYEQAVKWYRIAALKHFPKAQYQLGVKYINGHGVPKDATIAYAWFAVALNNGFAKAAQPLKVLNVTLPSEERQKALKMAAGQISAITHRPSPKK